MRIGGGLARLPPVLFEGTVIPWNSAVRDLGLILDNTMSWVPQVSEMSRKIFAAVGYLRRWKKFLPLKTKILLANSLLLPILDYADICYLDLSETMLDKLERLQNTPPYLKERFNFLGSNVQCYLRAKDDNRLHVPASHSHAYGNSFTVKVVILWNGLPRDIRQSKSLSIFKSRLKEYYLSTES
ncbi:jg5398 [Pararge aegeria aegeria]|uniref:Jg5398 protein n=1 Tax=Pararge aegeria aegeria TaxID=348720 RepID=A0A8S4R3W6_9NEOP|nr:jg5398 [Pararge aegeria aegeria]